MSEQQETRAERMARYKEERRRQLAAQFSDSLLMNRDGSSSGADGGPRMTRASRLRAAANNTSDSNSSPKRDVLRPGSAEKDKSGKRKSNLNRSLTSEEVPPDLSDDTKTRRRRRRFFPPEILLQQPQNSGSSNEEKLDRDASLTASSKTPPLSSPTTATARSRRSELSVHMENARRGVTAPYSELGKSRTPPPPTRLSNRNDFKEINGNCRQEANKENIKRKTDDSNLTKKERTKVPTTPPEKTRSHRITKRMDELTALTRETLARVERLANKTNESPTKNPSLGAKPKSTEKKPTEVETPPSIPVSILKRKVSQEESSAKSVLQTHTPPVTFSPNVIEPTITNRKQGILKKRRSLDESQVLRHRSCSPDVANKSDHKSILKTQRRSSLEDITRFNCDTIQGILKRKTSRNEEDLDNSLNSPQSILKRRSGASSAGSSSSTHHHVSITTAVILAAAEGAEMVLDGNNDGVRPILKKKSFSEETNGEIAESLKPILKKKSSTDTDEEEKPKRPILKMHSLERYNYYSANESGSECDVRPILKTGQRLSFCEDDGGESPDEDDARRRSSTRRSLLGELQMISNGASPREADRDMMRPRVVSVSELVMSFEKSTGAIPKKSSFKRNSDRCKTQPITFDELEASLSYVRSPQHEDFPRVVVSSPIGNSHSVRSMFDLSSSLDNECLSELLSSSGCKAGADTTGKMSSDSAFQSLGDGLELEQESPVLSPKLGERSALEKQMKSIAEEAKKLKLSKVNAGIQKYRNRSSLGVERSSARFSTQPITLEEVQEATKINAQPPQKSESDGEEAADPSKLSLSERIKLFSRKQTETCVRLEAPRLRRTRFITQPITSDEVETARSMGVLDAEKCSGSRSPPPAQPDDEGISSTNDSESDSDVKIIVSDELGSAVVSKSASSEQTSDESSGGREIQSIIGKEAVAKRRQQRERASSDSQALHKSRSHTAVSDEISSEKKLPFGVQRSMTTAAMRRTIGELQAKLQQSGDNDWRKRLPKLNNASEELNLLNVKNIYNEELSAEKKSILKAKKDELDASARQWKSRVEKTDAVSFSVAGRMQIKDIPSIPINIPVQDKVRRTPKAKRFKGKDDDGKDTSSTPVSPDLDSSLGFKRSISVPMQSTDESSGSDTSLRSSGRKVTVARPDDDTYKNFFKSIEIKRSEERVEVSLDDFDCITRHSDSLLVQKKNIKVQKRRGVSRNPLKVLAARSDIQNEYTEIITGVAERESKRLNVEKLAKNSNLAVEALAGLASKEDFAAVALKKASDTPNISYLPFKNLMLLHIKGRRHVQTRLVEPTAASINLGDNYILLTPRALYNYIGPYSNVIEQSRAADIINHIQQSGDMGCKVVHPIVVNTKKSTPSKDAEKFWKLLGAEPDIEVTDAGHPDEDEVYESTIVDTNMIYGLENNELVPLDNYWGAIPKIEMLQPSRVLVFDFGSEMYVWSGKNADPEQKKTALKLAKELWDNGYNYNECAVCPLNIAQMLGDRTKSNQTSKSDSRPEWALFAKITQHRETILFREKFLDWPDYSRVIKVKNNNNDKTTDTTFDIKPCDAAALSQLEHREPDFEIEGSHLGRGRHYFDNETNRNFEVATLDVTCWTIFENTYEKLEEECRGHFYDGDSYIVRWRFRVTVTGRELGGKPSKHCQLGRDRCVYFCWLGKHASTNEKGAAALLTVELDSEHARQIRVTQGSEPPAFLQLFNGKMFVHSGKRDAEKQERRLYICRGEIEHETALIEVPCSMRSLRSRASFVFVEPNSVTVWNGSKALGQTKDAARVLADYICANKPVDFNLESDLRCGAFEEGKEDATFLSALGEKRQLYNSLVKSGAAYEETPRMFHFCSISGVFEATEVLCPHRSLYTSPYPFLQSELYSANQPALFLLDNGHELWLWQGWWPERENDTTELSEQTGSGAVRWQTERRAAMQTAVDYWRVKNGDSKLVPAYLVWAGLEPLSFTNLFPVWCDRDDIAELNIKEGKKAGDMVPIEKELALLTRTTYPLAELLQRPLPDGVDPTHLEIYLSPDDFTTLLAISKEDFNKLPAWKQTALKKEKGLF